uniref:Jun dimerization protein 2 n=1 Tax=Bos taurus TaxID=9913 RepID=A0AAA9SQQ1_BOVIN
MTSCWWMSAVVVVFLEWHVLRTLWGWCSAGAPGVEHCQVSQLLSTVTCSGWTATPPAMMPGQIPDPSMTAGSLPGLGPLTGLPSSALTAEELKYADIRNIGAMIAPLHFLEVKLGKRPQPVKSELDEEEERRKRRREKNKVAAARCRNKKKERTEFLQRESERLELMNAELKTQIEELKQERQQLILMLNRHRPTCIVRTDSVKTPESEGNPLLEQLEKK